MNKDATNLLLLLLRGDRYSLSAICFAGFPGERERDGSDRLLPRDIHGFPRGKFSFFKKKRMGGGKVWKRRYLLVATEECVCRDDGGREKCV